MLNYVYKYTAYGEEVFMKDKDGFETWVYSCSTCEEAEKTAKKLQQKLKKDRPSNHQMLHASQYKF